VLQVGVIAEPEITHHTLMPYDKYLVLGSDGIWEFISSQEAAQVVHGVMGQGSAPTPPNGAEGQRARAAEACRKLCELSSIEWKKHEGDYRDDITGIVCRLPCFPPSGDAAGGSPGIKI
jgi:serine/threonine protein phosphatase PrpC